MSKYTSRLHNKAGLTLVETTIVLAIVSVIISAVWMVSSVVYENAHQYQANRQLQAIVQNVRQLYARLNALTNLADVTITLDAQAAFPIEMRVNQSNAAGLINHPWASTATGSVKIFNRTSTTFGVVFSNLPKKACIGLATKLTGGEITNLSQVIINGTITPSSALPISVVSANLSCTSPNANSFEWQFNIRG
ncbi:MAG: prepilin-type N-terminal cleavage/methylation domain-containing protein [Alphaproteobacteria bacterium]|nr:prepilin-type N-terminal cleavage/methylation domain-containing protein [Alphaproteobacteria bacterium]